MTCKLKLIEKAVAIGVDGLEELVRVSVQVVHPIGIVRRLDVIGVPSKTGRSLQNGQGHHGMSKVFPAYRAVPISIQLSKEEINVLGLIIGLGQVCQQLLAGYLIIAVGIDNGKRHGGVSFDDLTLGFLFGRLVVLFLFRVVVVVVDSWLLRCSRSLVLGDGLSMMVGSTVGRSFSRGEAFVFIG